MIGGGGAGLVAAWLIQDDAEVTLFEADERLGGHASTITVETERGAMRVDCGFRYFFPTTYPNFIGLMDVLGIEPQENVASMSFRGPADRFTLTVPPPTLGHAAQLALRPRNLIRALSFLWFLRAGRRIVRAGDWGPSLREFLASSGIPKTVADDYLVPALAASWGAPVPEMFDFPAYDVLRVMQQGKAGTPHFFDVPGGASTYIDAIAADSPAVEVRTNTAVTQLVRDGTKWRVVMGDEVSLPFDQVVLATPALAAAPLFAASENHPAKSLAASFRYFDTDIVIHRDTTLMPPERDAWGVINVRFDGARSWTTEWVGRNTGAHVFRTWLPEGHPLPDDVILRRRYKHLIVDGRSRGLQLEIARRQGEDGIYLAGMYTCDVDNHESAVASGIHAAGLIAEGSVRLARVRKAIEARMPGARGRKPSVVASAGNR